MSGDRVVRDSEERVRLGSGHGVFGASGLESREEVVVRGRWCKMSGVRSVWWWRQWECGSESAS